MPERVITCLNGKRGSYLLVGGVAYMFIGLSYVFASTPGRQAAFQWLPPALTPALLGLVWVVGGLVALLVSLVSRRHRRAERVGYMALMLCPMLWVGIYATSTVVGTHPNGWISAILYGLIAAWVWVVAGWDNPAPPLTDPVRTVGGGTRD